MIFEEIIFKFCHNNINYYKVNLMNLKVIFIMFIYGCSILTEKPLLKRIAEKVLGSEYVDLIWRRIEVVGDIAIIRKPFNLSEDIFKVVGEELLKTLPYIRSVWLAVTPVHGIERVRNYIHLAGEKKSETVYKEYGCIFKVDITKVYISPVLGYDHIRIAKMVREDEKILNMFAGFGPYSIIASRYAKPSYILSIDINEYAVRYMKINIELNKVATINEIIHGDSLFITSSFRKEFNRILMPYPDLFEKAMEVALLAVKENGYIHPHLFIEAENKRDALIKASEKVKDLAMKLGALIEPTGGHVIRGVAPRKYHVAIDAIVKRKI